ncbi:sugar ABC transporter substrate-binding protein [Celeribacter halophilus]|uniref:sugar ABC transporter substrate-binding protein n=1 Tax=Celeribacter halophilus TaxID=576117 RepID=UPI003A8D0744
MQLKKKSAATIGALILSTGLAAAADRPEIYSRMPDTALSGLLDTEMPDRTDIFKALPEGAVEKEKITIGWTEITLGNPWFVEVVEAAKRMGEEMGGYEFDIQVANGDPLRTSAHFDAFIAKGVDVIVVDPTDVVGAATDAERAVEAGIPVIALGTVPDASGPFVTTVLSNPYSNGFDAGVYTAEQMSSEEKIIAGVTIGTLGNSTSESRVNGLLTGIVYGRSKQFGLGMTKEDALLKGFELFQEMKKAGHFDWKEGGFQVVGVSEGYWTEEGGLAGAEDLLAAHGDEINLFLAENDFMGIGALTALDNIGLKGKVPVACGSDGFRVSLELIRKGDLLVTGANSGRATGEGVMKLINMIFREGYDANNLPLGSYYPGEIITKENIEQYWDPDENNPFFKYEVPPFRTIPEIRNQQD